MNVACKQGATGTNTPRRIGMGGHTGAGADIVDDGAQLVCADFVLTGGLQIKQRSAHDTQGACLFKYEFTHMHANIMLCGEDIPKTRIHLLTLTNTCYTHLK